jgi:hypothetical protein
VFICVRDLIYLYQHIIYFFLQKTLWKELNFYIKWIQISLDQEFLICKGKWSCLSHYLIPRDVKILLHLDLSTDSELRVCSVTICCLLSNSLSLPMNFIHNISLAIFSKVRSKLGTVGLWPRSAVHPNKEHVQITSSTYFFTSST